MRTHLADDPGFEKQVQGFVNRGQRDGGKLVADTLEDALRIGMIRHLHQRTVENQPLVRHRQLFFMAEPLKFVFERTSHTE